MSRLFHAPYALRATVRDAAKHHLPSITSSSSSSSSRAFSSLPALRPRTHGGSPCPSSCASPPTPAVFAARRPTTSLLSAFFLPTATTTAAALDLVPAAAAITAHPALAGGAAQIRCGPRRYMNMNRPSRLIRNRRTGFLTRMKTKDGRKTLARRRIKGRKRLGAA